MGHGEHQRRPATADPAQVTQELARLEALDLTELRVAFRNRTGRIAPARISRALLFKLLAYRVQVEAYGDLRPEARRMLDRMSSDRGRGEMEATVNGAAARRASAVPIREVPKRGSVLVREWRGRMEHVMVLENGFTWNGNAYPSLSAVAVAMTGTKWNGRRFFGLDRKESRPARTTAQREARGERKQSPHSGAMP